MEQKQSDLAKVFAVNRLSGRRELPGPEDMREKCPQGWMRKQQHPAPRNP